MATYEHIDAVAAEDDGVVVRLNLQQRIDLPPSPFFTVSWRTSYPGTDKNRRFYWAKDRCWTVRASTTRKLLNSAENSLSSGRNKWPHIRCRRPVYRDFEC